MVSTPCLCRADRGADRKARKRGRGLEFADHRGYSAGDDFRHIDWKAYQRLGRLLLRLFDEEQDLPIYLFIDSSRSMAEPAQVRSGAAHRGGALLHRPGAPRSRDAAAVRHQARRRDGCPAAARDASSACSSCSNSSRPRGPRICAKPSRPSATRTRQAGLAVVISDFLDPHGFEPGLKMLASMRHDVFAVHITSERDRDPGALGEVRFVDAETGELRDVDVTPSLAAAYGGAWQHASGRGRALLRPLQPRLHPRGCRAAVRARHPEDVPARDGSCNEFRRDGLRGRRCCSSRRPPRRPSGCSA